MTFPNPNLPKLDAGTYVYTGGMWTRGEEDSDGKGIWVTYKKGDQIVLTEAEATRLGALREIRELNDDEKKASGSPLPPDPEKTQEKDPEE